MKYTFKEILNQEIYDSTLVMVIAGKYDLFNNMVVDTLKAKCIEKIDTGELGIAVDLGDEFGVQSNDAEDVSNSVNFDTFMEVVGVPSINGKWFCRAELSVLSNKQKEKLFKYLKEPSKNGILVITSNEFKVYKDILNNKQLAYGVKTHLMQLSFTNKPILKKIIQTMFEDKGITIESGAVDLFMFKMNSAYDEYEEVLEDIIDGHIAGYKITLTEVRDKMKGIEHFDLDDFILEVAKPLSNDKTNNKKVYRMMIALIDQYGASGLITQLIKYINECIEFRMMINSGIIPVKVDFFMKDVVALLDKESKYAKMNEWLFKRKAQIAAQTSLRDWQYMKLILSRVSVMDDDSAYIRAIYDLVTRSVLTSSRLDNIVGLDNVLNNRIEKLNRIKYK